MSVVQRLAAVDLGSNSFRLEIGRVEHGVFRREEYIKETVRQGAGLDDQRNLTPAAMQAGWDCLARFGERLAGFDVASVRAVATQTLREARNRDDFLIRANRLLGFPIDIISGREEARLIYQGVSHLLHAAPEQRLVIDIGGRSTELIVGQGGVPQVMESYRVGSVAWSQRYFEQGLLTRAAFAQAEIAAVAVLDEAQDVFHRSKWQVAYGSAGTIGAIAEILQAAGWPEGEISQEGLDWLRDRFIAAQALEKLKIAGLREDRKQVIGGGLSVLRALFHVLGIDVLRPADGGLRYGLICQLLGADERYEDLRIQSVNRLAQQFAVDAAHAQRVSLVAEALLQKLLPKGGAHQVRLLRKIRWAGQLHEIGAYISHSEQHKHGAYIVEHADVMGFSQAELHRLSLLILGHRGKVHKLGDVLADADFCLQLLALRLAVLLSHARRDPDLQPLQIVRASGPRLAVRIDCSLAWAAAYPQSMHLLQSEVAAWQKTPLLLNVFAK